MSEAGGERRIRVHGLDLSYFTGKIEAYLRAKGLAYTLVELDTRAFAEVGRRTGVRQMPALELADGRWLTDTPRIIDALEAAHPKPRLTPADPVARFLAELLEAYGDEHLWRPALYYRWAFADDARLMSARLARGMLRDVPLPFALRRLLILARQRRAYLAGDGVTRATAPAIEGLYRDTLAALETALADRPFLLGARPTRADFGFFGPLFRHFFSDPTPAGILRSAAPRTQAWVARLWALQSRDYAHAPEVEGAAPGLEAIAARIAAEFLPYLAANAQAYAQRARHVFWASGGVAFRTPVSAYRVWRYARLIDGYAALDRPARETAAAWLGRGGAQRLDVARPAIEPAGAGSMVRDRTWKTL